MKLLDLYTEYFANWLSDGQLISRDKISLLGIRPLYDRYYTHNWINKVWAVVKLPVNYDLNLTHAIRQEMFELCPEVRTVVHMYSQPVNINAHSDVFKRQLHNAENRYESYRSIFDSLTAGEQMTGATEIDRRSGRRISVDRGALMKIKDDCDSYTYVYSTVNRGMGYSDTYFFIQASAKSRRQMDKYKKGLTSLLMSEDIRFMELHGTIGQYLDNFCPASFVHNVTGKIPTMLFSQENTAALVPNKIKGLINSKGIPIAVDWESKLPFFLDFFGSGSAQVIMLLARSGWGKTFFAFVIAVLFAGYEVHFSAMDIKGYEWKKLEKYVPLLIINMNGVDARFVNTLRLDDIQCDKYSGKDFYDTAVSGTVTLFEIATNLTENEGNVADLRAILDQAVIKLFNMHGIVKENVNTFALTKDLKYSDVLVIISNLSKTRAYTEQHRKVCALIILRCSPFFTSEGRFSEAFKNELTVREILDNPGVIYSFNKNSTESLDTLDDIRVHMAQFLDSKKASVRKGRKLHTAAFYEELQRCKSFETMIENISSNVTGSRSNNLTVFLLLNSVKTLQQEAFASIKSNITTKIVGKVTTDDIRILADHFDCKDIEDYLYSFNKDELCEQSNCFAISYDTGNTRGCALLKSIVPVEMQEEFKTRDIKE